MTTLPPSHERETPGLARGYDLETGAGNETRTRDPDLGKVVLYQLSYSRPGVPCGPAPSGNANFQRLRSFCQGIGLRLNSGQAAFR